MLSIDLLISTMNYRQGTLGKLLATVPDFVNVIVVNQITEASEVDVSVQLQSNVVCHSFQERGLSKSRNRLIALAVSDVLIISDDDVEFLPDAFVQIRQAFLDNPLQDIVTFKMLKPNGDPRKFYKSRPFQHNRFSIGKVSSCEIAVRRESLQSAKVTYDEMFGLGAPYSMGEEVVFLRDCLKAGLNIRFIPIAISCHPEESTGREFSSVLELSRGAMFYRLYGGLSYLLGAIFYLKKRRKLATSIGYGGAVRAYWGGIHDYKKYCQEKPADRFVCVRADHP